MTRNVSATTRTWRLRHADEKVPRDPYEGHPPHPKNVAQSHDAVLGQRHGTAKIFPVQQTDQRTRVQDTHLPLTISSESRPSGDFVLRIVQNHYFYGC